MAPVAFPWRPLGRLLVERGVLTEVQLSRALAEQLRTGQPLGRILVGQGWIAVYSLTSALAEQHGVVLRDDREPPAVSPDPGNDAPPPSESGATWMPLGRLLIEKGLIDQVQLKQALAEQREHGQPLGEILVDRGWISAPVLAQAIAEQHGLELDDESALRARLGSASDGRFDVRELRGGAWETLHTSPTFLDATDFAFEILYDREPEMLAILRMGEPVDEVVWSYSREDAAPAIKDPELLDVFGYPVASWDAAPWIGGDHTDDSPKKSR
jgi:hypothetical protein